MDFINLMQGVLSLLVLLLSLRDIIKAIVNS